jgi:hypothetical protein
VFRRLIFVQRERFVKIAVYPWFDPEQGVVILRWP